jgi:hypothetical protein
MAEANGPIEQVYLTAYRRDFWFTQICVGSIRYWYPKVPIALIKDLGAGDFETGELEKNWDVKLFPTPVKNFGGGFAKLEPLFLEEKQRCLILDSDVVFVGRVLDALERAPGDFVIHAEDNLAPNGDHLSYDPEALRRFDPSFHPPSFIFNSGNYVATTGLLHRSDFSALVNWTEPRTLRRPDIFRGWDQGPVNYLVFKGRAEGRFTMAREVFYLWAETPSPALNLELIKRRTSPPMMMHWVGRPKSSDFAGMARADVLRFFRDYHDSRSARLPPTRASG